MRADRTVLRVGATSLEARVERGRQQLWAGQSEYHTREELADAIARLVAEPEILRSGKRLVVELLRPVVQLRTLNDVPPVRSALVRPLVEQQAQRYFRKNGCPLVLDAVRTGGLRSRTVQAAAVEEPVIQAIAEGARAGGFQLEQVRPAEWPELGLSLLMKEERDRRTRNARLSIRRLGIAVALLWLGAVAAGIGSHRVQSRAVEEQLGRLVRSVAAIAEARRQLHLAESSIARLDLEQAMKVRQTRLVLAIAGALPDSAFLTSLDLDSTGSGRITGYAARASEVLARLDGADVVTAPELESRQPRQSIAGREWENFSIRFGAASPRDP